ncbi:ABC transporter substrate-binding protein [Inquilinus sp. CAU 1745]|uniref:ABC transporter substrate-binding protein n=1 Tax=Inquilinus sp. CAU 1745 TaxID=3140369 RepID=UPI00325AE042
MIVTWRGCEEACQGFKDYLDEQGVPAEFLMRDAGQQKETIPGFLEDARNADVDLILTWGTSVTRGIAGTLADRDNPTFNNDIPQVFMIVADPVGSGIVESLERTGRSNMTGTYNRMPEQVTIQTIRSYHPEFQRLGMLYNANERNSVVKRDEMAELAEAMDFELVALELPLGDDGAPRPGDIASMVAQLKSEKVDFIYLGSSSFLLENGSIFTTAAVENGIPFLSPYEQLVRDADALISVASRYYDVGRLAGRQAERILIGGASPGDLPVLRMTDFAVVINLAVAEKLNLFPPMDLLYLAETVD